MDEPSEYQPNFKLSDAYDFLGANALGSEADGIRSSGDKLGSYEYQLKRAKGLSQNNILIHD